MKKLCFSLLVGIAVLVIIGCSTITVSYKSNTLRSKELTPSAYSTTFADLAVADKKVMGQAKGSPNEKEILEERAITDALKDNADVLVGVNFFYEVKNGVMDVTVIGYPAEYKNFRTAKKSDTLILNRSMGYKPMEEGEEK